MPDSRFHVYVHARPNGQPFYVGKGTRRRARDMSPTRRTLHHRNICEKYGLSNIQVHMIAMASEAEAFEFEIFLIDEMRRHGVSLCNITDGGEGASMPITPVKMAALDKGRDTRWRGKQYALHLKGGTKQCHCVTCGKPFLGGLRAQACSKRCQQIAYRAKTQTPVERVRVYANNKTGRTGIAIAPDGKFKAHIGLGGKLLHLGTFASFDEAVAARTAAEARYAQEWNGGKGTRAVPREA